MALLEATAIAKDVVVARHIPQRLKLYFY